MKQDDIAFNLSHSIPKKSYANRCVISTANGLQTLSIPIQGGRGTKLAYREIEISYADNWIAKHKMAMKSAYSKSPFYEFYIDSYETTISTKYRFLHELNLNLFLITTGILKSSQHIHTAELETIPNYERFSPSVFNDVPPYPQVFRSRYSFQPDLCILDLIFNIGNQSHAYLTSPKT